MEQNMNFKEISNQKLVVVEPNIPDVFSLARLKAILSKFASERRDENVFP